MLQFQEASFYLMRMLGILCLKDPGEEVATSLPVAPPSPKQDNHPTAPVDTKISEDTLATAASVSDVENAGNSAHAEKSMVAYARALVAATAQAAKDGSLGPLQQALDDAINAGMPHDCTAAVRARKLLTSLRAAHEQDRATNTPRRTTHSYSMSASASESPSPIPVLARAPAAQVNPSSVTEVASTPTPALESSVETEKPVTRQQLVSATHAIQATGDTRHIGTNVAESTVAPDTPPDLALSVHTDDSARQTKQSSDSEQHLASKKLGKKTKPTKLKKLRFNLVQIQECNDPTELFRLFSKHNHADHIVHIWAQLLRVLSIEKDYSFDRWIHMKGYRTYTIGSQ